MQFPPDSNKSMPEYPDNGKSPFDPYSPPQSSNPSNEKNSATSNAQSQIFFLHEAPPPSTPGIVIRTRSSGSTGKKRNFILAGLLLSIIIIIVVPVVSLQIFFHSSKAPSTPEGGTAALPMGRTILPTPGKIMTGVHIADNLNSVSTFDGNAGKEASIILFYQDWGATGGDQNFPMTWATSVRNQGSIPMIIWEPWTSKSNTEPTYALSNIIAGNFDDYIKQWAQDAKAWKHPFFLSFAPEMNGDWIPWSERVNGNSAGEFVQAWRHVHAIFTAVGATNVTWVWDPNIDYPGSTPLSELYPGDAYVDWTAMDGFNWGIAANHKKWQTFSQVFSPTYEDILKITQKPMMIAETGCSEKGGNKAAWITDAYSVALPEHFSGIKAVVWSELVTQEDWRIESSPAALKAFAKEMQSPLYASNSYGGTFVGG